MMNNDKLQGERELFEARFPKARLERNSLGDYVYEYTQYAWSGWQARAALASDAEPVGFITHKALLKLTRADRATNINTRQEIWPTFNRCEKATVALFTAPPSAAQAVEAVQLVAKLAQQFPDCDTTLTVEQFADWLKANIHTESAQVERDAKDAARYRWILNNAKATDALWEYAIPETLMGERHISNAIDAAIASAKRED
jgi:hypothetical protein